jgi:hypothetical protein
MIKLILMVAIAIFFIGGGSSALDFGTNTEQFSFSIDKEKALTSITNGYNITKETLEQSSMTNE